MIPPGYLLNTPSSATGANAMPIFYVCLFYDFPEGSEQPFKPEFRVEAESFSGAAAKARVQMRTEYPGEVPDSLHVTEMGWPLPGARTPKRLS